MAGAALELPVVVPDRVGADLHDAMNGPPNCGRCGGPHASTACPNFFGERGDHADAEPGDHVPHMFQVPWKLLDRREASEPRRVRVEGHELVVGTATSLDNDCLIHTLAQQLGVQADMRRVRGALIRAFPRGGQRVTHLSFLELQFHGPAVLRELGFDPGNYRLVCVDLDWVNNGGVVGKGAETLYLARERQSHFVPLRREVP